MFVGDRGLSRETLCTVIRVGLFEQGLLVVFQLLDGIDFAQRRDGLGHVVVLAQVSDCLCDHDLQRCCRKIPCVRSRQNLVMKSLDMLQMLARGKTPRTVWKCHH